jgi:hypothetical protein
MQTFRILLLLCAIASATVAHADTVEIRFDLSGSTLNFPSLATIPPEGTIRTMGATAVLPATKTTGGATVVQTGVGAFKSFTMDLTVSAGVPFFARVTGTVILDQVGTVTGPFTNTQTLIFGGPTGSGAPQDLQFFRSVHLDCAGLLCGSLGSFPITSVGTPPPGTGTGTGTGTPPEPQPQSLFLANLNTPGAAALSGTLFISQAATTTGDPFTGSIPLVGTEVSRTYVVPEPSFIVMLVPGLVGLAGLSLRRRRSGGAAR